MVETASSDLWSSSSISHASFKSHSPSHVQCGRGLNIASSTSSLSTASSGNCGQIQGHEDFSHRANICDILLSRHLDRQNAPQQAGLHLKHVHVPEQSSRQARRSQKRTDVGWGHETQERNDSRNLYRNSSTTMPSHLHLHAAICQVLTHSKPHCR